MKPLHVLLLLIIHHTLNIQAFTFTLGTLSILWASPPVLAFHCCTPNYHTLNGLTHLLFHHFLGSGVQKRLNWALCSGPTQGEIKVLAWLCSFWRLDWGRIHFHSLLAVWLRVSASSWLLARGHPQLLEAACRLLPCSLLHRQLTRGLLLQGQQENLSPQTARMEPYIMWHKHASDTWSLPYSLGGHKSRFLPLLRGKWL